MATKKTLKELFESRKDELLERLGSLTLPKDSSKVQAVATDYLNELFDSDGEFRQNLTQSEDFILQAAMSLLNAQQSMICELSSSIQPKKAKQQESAAQEGTKQNLDYGSSLRKEQYPYVVGGTTVGGAAGALIFGTWGAVFGAIAGTALVLYYSSQLSQDNRKNSHESQQTRIVAKPIVKEQKINADLFVAIVGNICDSVDTLIQTFRAQINRVVDKYENTEKPSLEQEYRFLVEGIQTLIGYKRTHIDDEKYVSKLQMRIEDLAETLENYNLSVEDYSEENKSWFEAVESPNVDEPKMVYPAIVKNCSVILQGKVFIPQKNKLQN